jgi:hypothetical protein
VNADARRIPRIDERDPVLRWTCGRGALSGAPKPRLRGGKFSQANPKRVLMSGLRVLPRLLIPGIAAALGLAICTSRGF